MIGVVDDTASFTSQIRLFRDSETNMFKNKYLTLRLRMLKDGPDSTQTEYTLFDAQQLNLTQFLRSHYSGPWVEPEPSIHEEEEKEPETNLEINPDVLDLENKEEGETADIRVGAALLDNAQAVDIIPSATGAEEDDDELSLRGQMAAAEMLQA